MSDGEIVLTTADMLEIAASGGNGSEYVNMPNLMETAAKELRASAAEIERLRAALREIGYSPGSGIWAAKKARAALEDRT